MKFVIICSIALLAGLILAGHYHEEVHVSIFKSYGIESRVEYFSEFPDFVTIAEEPCPTEECNLAHNINESISYVLLPIYCAISVFLLCIVSILEMIFEIKCAEMFDARKNN